VVNPDRLTGLDSSFLHLERDSAHMHVGACTIFEGPAPEHDELIEAIVNRLHLVPRYRQRLAYVPFEQGRPVWVDDPHFNPRYHVRDTALPRPGGEDELKRLAARVFSQALDRAKPLCLEYEAAGVRFYQPLRRESWGAWSFIVEDPNGNLIAFGGRGEHLDSD